MSFTKCPQFLQSRWAVATCLLLWVPARGLFSRAASHPWAALGLASFWQRSRTFSRIGTGGIAFPPPLAAQSTAAAIRLWLYNKDIAASLLSEVRAECWQKEILHFSCPRVSLPPLPTFLTLSLSRTLTLTPSPRWRRQLPVSLRPKETSLTSPQVLASSQSWLETFSGWQDNFILKFSFWGLGCLVLSNRDLQEASFLQWWWLFT